MPTAPKDPETSPPLKLLFGPCLWEESAWRGVEEPLEDGGISLTIEEWSVSERAWVPAEDGSFVFSKLALAPGIPIDIARDMGMDSDGSPIER